VILDDIVACKRQETGIPEYRAKINAYINGLHAVPTVNSLSQALNKQGKVSLLAEIKRASPSKGIIRDDVNPAEVAAIYQKNGAAAISVLTDARFFRGDPGYIPLVKKTVDLPLLRKDFIIDPLQIYEASMLGADAVLLIVSILDDSMLAALSKLAGELNMECLVEVHSQEELKRACGAGAGIIGINNRDLKTFKTDIMTTLRLIEQIDQDGVVTVSESGINTAADVAMMRAAGVNAVLVGEALMRETDIGGKVRELAGAGCL